MKIVLGGPPRSGKSCLREALKQAILRIDGAPYPFFITGCPDGEGSWFQPTAAAHPGLASKLKAENKRKFIPAFVDRVAEDVRTCQSPLTFVDLGGIPDAANAAICASATHAILIAGDVDQLSEWREFCRPLAIRIFAEIHSDYAGAEDRVPVPGPDGVLRGSIHHLERGEIASERPTVQALAAAIVRMAQAEAAG